MVGGGRWGGGCWGWGGGGVFFFFSEGAGRKVRSREWRSFEAGCESGKVCEVFTVFFFFFLIMIDVFRACEA